MLQYSCECDPNTLSLFQSKILEAIGCIRNINKQRPDDDPIYKHISRLETSNMDKTTATNIIDALIDRNVIENRKATSVQVPYFYQHKESNKTITASPEKLEMKLICLSQPAASPKFHPTF